MTARRGSSFRPCGRPSNPASRSPSRSSSWPRTSRHPSSSSGAGWVGAPSGRVPLEHKTRGVYAVTLPAPTEAIEYYVEVKADGETARFPATAPELNQTVIVLPEAR